jgi:hypothetical protein
MNADIFYDKFREAVNFFGLSWGEKHYIRVRVSENQLCFEHDGTEIRVTIPVMYADT